MRILIIDDDPTVCSSLRLWLTRKGFEVDTINQPKVALETINSYQPELILLDMNFTIDTSGRQGIQLLKEIRKSFDQISVILMTGWATVQLAVEGMKLGAKDFIAKPWDNKDLFNSIESIRKIHHDSNQNIIPLSGNEQSSIIGSSEVIQSILSMVRKIAATEASVLITGESGTGKELIAEAIHQQSNRSTGPFVKVNLGGIPRELFESEMFGHLKGAFTGAHNDREGRFTKAQNGTIFLDEIGELEFDSQVKLLRVLQEKTYEPLGSSETLRTDVRVISATNRNLPKLAAVQKFREDLYYRINLIHIHLPPLRERRTDIPELIKSFINKTSALYGTTPPMVREDTLIWLSKQEYKGNIRQLKNIVERTFILNIEKKELSQVEFLAAFNYADPSTDQLNNLNLQSIEIEVIKKALTKYDHSISASARALGITRSSLYRRLEKYGIPYEPKI